MITPKPATILELYRGHPERWVKAAAARNYNRAQVPPCSEEAVCWCISGAISFVYGNPPEDRDDATIRAVVKKLSSAWRSKFKNRGMSIVAFNDDAITTFEELLAVVEEAGV